MAGLCVFCGCSLPADGSYAYCGQVCQVMAGCSGTHDPKGCWTWQRAKRENGYGIMRVWIGTRYAMRSPSRVIYAAEYGEVPYTASVLQKCGTKNCCNPRHLRLGVQELELTGQSSDYGKSEQLWPETETADEMAA